MMRLKKCESTLIELLSSQVPNGLEELAIYQDKKRDLMSEMD